MIFSSFSKSVIFANILTRPDGFPLESVIGIFNSFSLFISDPQIVKEVSPLPIKESFLVVF